MSALQGPSAGSRAVFERKRARRPAFGVVRRAASTVTALAALLLGSAEAATPATTSSWPQEAWNPQPAADDLVLPLPCGGAMAFRPVPTPPEGSSLLADRAVRLGGENVATGYADYFRRAYILGGLPDPRGHGRLFYIGKHEVTRDQYAALHAPDCRDVPAPIEEGALPQSGVSWFDAVDYSRRLSEWLLANAKDRLPKVGDVPAYLRLPTEVEWEYAARGGGAQGLTEERFRAPLFPMEGGVTEYAWHEGAESANGALNLIGLLKPNPLGLYDILGNVEELVLDPFHLNRRGREHGQAGGFVTKGGSFRDAASRLRTFMRFEHAHYDPVTGKAKALDSFGFRLVVAAPVLISQQQIDKLREEWNQLGSASRTTGLDPGRQLRELIDSVTDQEMRQRLQLVDQAFGEEIAKRNEVESRALRTALLNGALFLRMLEEDHRQIAAREAARATMASLLADAEKRKRDAQAQTPPNPGQGRRDERAAAALDAELREKQASLAQYDATLRQLRTRFTRNQQAYTGTLFQLADDYPPARHQEQLAVLVQELQRSGQGDHVPYAERFVSELGAYAANPGLGVDELVRRVIGR